MPKKIEYHARSVNDPGDYQDSESNFGPSLTDPSMDEPIEKLVARMMRGEIVGGISPQYDVPENMTPEQAFIAQPITERGDFDLADAPAIVKRGQEALEALKKGQKSKEAEKPQEAKQPVQEPAPKA